MNGTLGSLPTPAQLCAQAAELTELAGGGRTSATAYDTAGLAALRAPDGSTPLFPGSLSWLRVHQHADGSWGATSPHAHDRLVSTLAAAVALVDVDEEWARAGVIRAVGYLGRAAGGWVDEYPDTIGFELVVPRLVDRAHHAGMPLPYEQLRSIEKIRDAKLAKIPRERLFDRAGNLAFSAEFLTDAGAVQLRGLKSANGSYACSPSASAAAWAITGDPDTWSYLESIATTDGGAAPAIFPMDVFDRAWVLGPLAGAGLLGPAAAPVGRYLADALGPDGAPASRVGPAPDSDTTAMSILAAQAVGQDCAGKLAALLRYETTDHFRCFAFERDPSISANARIRHALASNGPDRFATQINKADSFLADVRTGSGYWGDKWHLSPYYTTAVVVAGGRDRTWSWAPTTSWLLESQRDNGSWGVYSGSSEETAYAVAMLDSLTDAGDPRAGHAIAKAAAYLVGDRDAEHAELWIAKGLYAPLNVISAYVLAALAVCRRRLVAQA